MGSRYPYFMLGMLIVLCVVVGWVARGVISDVNIGKAMAWGFDDKTQLWNRIRVDAEGHVICSKE